MSFSSFRCLAGNALSWTLWDVCQKYLFFSVGIFQRGIEAANFSPFPREHVCMVQGDGPRCLFIKQRQRAISGLSGRFCCTCAVARAGGLSSLRWN